MSDYAIIKIDSLRIQEEFFDMNKAIGAIDADSFAKLIDTVDLTANPRESKANKVTAAIIETLEKNPDMMVFKSKGLLISTTRCTSTDNRQTISLSFKDREHEGILDGGHTLFAVAYFILKSVGVNEPRLKRIKTWHELMIVWREKRSIITSDTLKEFTFKIPIEIICPKSELTHARFCKYVYEIAIARNNNTQLKESAKADHNGYYSYLKKCLDSQLNDKVEWKQNEAHKPIKRDDIIALSLIPLYALQQQGGLPAGIAKITPLILYNNKARCIIIFNDIIKSFLSNKEEMSNAFKSAIEMMGIIPKLYDAIHQKFPELFNKVDRLSAYCKRSDTKKQYKTKFYQYDVDYDISSGFILPIMFALHQLMHYEKAKQQLIWHIEPEYFINQQLIDIEAFCAVIKKHGNLADKVAKDGEAYSVMEEIVRGVIK
jgi:hypothetical protein